MVWDRRRALELFNFDYRLECYTPKGKRQYGYFTLPVLNRGELIGRIDAKMHRRTGEFEVISFHLGRCSYGQAALSGSVSGY